jgi:hypothetical protein
VGDGHDAPEIFVVLEHHSGTQLGGLDQHTVINLGILGDFD